MAKVTLGILIILMLFKGITPSAGVDDSWRRVADLPIPRTNHAAAVVAGQIYILGGYDDGGMNVVMEYDPVTDQWHRIADMLTPRGDLAAAVVNGKIYAIGGADYPIYYSTVEEYDPITDSWRSRAPMPTPRFGLAAVAVEGKIYAIGGTERGDSPSNAVEEYDPATDIWRSRAPMPTARYGLAAAEATLSGKIYAIGGEYRNGRIQYLRTVEEYDPVTDSWCSRAPMPTPRYFHAAVAEGSRLYVLGGYNSDVGDLAVVEEYDPATDIWASRTPMPTARRGLAAVAVGGRIYAIGGESGRQVVEEYVPFNYEEVPTVTVVSPFGGEYWSGTSTITWTTTDPQGDPLTYTVYYSPNGGQTWTQLATELTEPSYLWDTTTVVDGTNYLIKVVASDGTHTGVDVSNAPFEIANALFYSTEWTQTYGGPGDESVKAVQTKDGGFVLAGYTTSYGAGGMDAWLVKTDAHGEVEWTRTYGGLGDDSASAVIEMTDGSFVLAGSTNSSGAGGKDFWLVKTDVRGEVEWTRTYGSPKGEGTRVITQTADGGFALAGYTTSSGAGSMDAWLVKTDARGVMQWNQRYGDANAESNWAVSVIETVDKGFVLAIGSSYSGGGGYPGTWLVKIDANGNEEWTRRFTSMLLWFYAGIQTEDGGFAFVGSCGTEGDSQLVKTDATGNEEWQRAYSGHDSPRHYIASAIIQTEDGGFALTGQTDTYRALDAILDAWLVKTDATGRMEWIRTYGGLSGDKTSAVIEMADGSFVLAGTTASFGAGGLDAWLVKTIPPETTPPELSAPEDIAYEEGARGQVINWTVEDRNPETYVLYNNSVQMDSGLWMNGTITWNVDGLALGTYNITLVARDLFNNSASDTVWVTVTTPTPDITTPETPPLPELPVISTPVLLSLATLATLGVRRKRLRRRKM